MVHVNQTDKFTQFLQATSQSQQSDPYDVDLKSSNIEQFNTQNGEFFSILGCEEGTVISNCGCISTVLTACGCL